MKDLRFKLWILWALLTNAWDEWRTTVWSEDFDSPYCCNGDMCGCGAHTNRDLWLRQLELRGVDTEGMKAK